MAITKAQQFCTEVQVGMSQKEEEEPEEVGRCLTRKYVSNANMPHIQTLISKYHGPRTKEITNHQSHEVLHPRSDGHALDKSIQREIRVDSARVGAALVLMSTL